MMELKYLYMFAIFIGAWLRVLLPFFRKILNGELELDDYDQKYTILFLVSYVVAWVVTAMLYLENPYVAGLEIEIQFFLGIKTGFLAQAAVNEVAKLVFPEDWWDRDS